MKCPYCNGSTKVTNSRSHNNDLAVWRRRQCKNCSAIWSTDEELVLSTTHNVIGLDNSIQPFIRDKLFVSILDSLSHLSDSQQTATELTSTIIDHTIAMNSALVKLEDLKSNVFSVLNNFDKTAASVYKAKYF